MHQTFTKKALRAGSGDLTVGIYIGPLDGPWAEALAYERGNPVGLGKVWTAFDRVSIKVRALLSGSRHFVNVASFVDLAKGFVHLQGYLAHKRQRPPSRS